MTRRFFSGNSLEQAVMLAARHHGVEPDELAYRKVEKRHGFLRTRRAVVIAVDPENPRKPATGEPGAEAASAEAVRAEPPAAAEPAAAEPAVAESPPRQPRREPPPPPAPAVRRERPRPEPAVIDQELLSAAERATAHLMKLAGVRGEIVARAGEERVEIEISGPDEQRLLAEDGRGLLAIQHLLPRMLRGLAGRSSFVRVDSGGFHAQRRARLAELARSEAEAARSEGRPRILPPMAPDERRLVHLALADDPTVETESRGGGWHKRVVVRPVGDGGEPA